MKMRVKSESMVLKNVYFLSAALIFVSCFIGCTAVSGSCLSYGHSCWGAHGKRSGLARVLLGPERRTLAAAPPIADDRWLLTRLLGRQSALAARLRARPLSAEELSPLILPAAVLDEATGAGSLPLKPSLAAEKLFQGAEVRSIPKAEQSMTEGESSDILFSPQRKDLVNDDDQAIKIGLYKILKNLDDKSK